MAQCDAAGVNGSNRILFHGAPRLRLMPNGCLGSPVLVLLFGLDRGFLMDVGPPRARVVSGTQGCPLLLRRRAADPSLPNGPAARPGHMALAAEVARCSNTARSPYPAKHLVDL